MIRTYYLGHKIEVSQFGVIKISAENLVCTFRTHLNFRDGIKWARYVVEKGLSNG